MFQSSYISALLVLGAFLLLQLFFYLFGRYQKSNALPDPMVSSVVRGPGQSLLTKIQEVGDKLQRVVVFLLLVPVSVFTAHLCYSYFGQVPESMSRTVISLGGGMGIMCFYLSRFFRIRSHRRRLQSGYDGAVLVARKLNDMHSLGYRVFHDVPGEGINIDHILIGPAGVMAVETKTLSKTKGMSRSRTLDAVVTYDGRMLHFPKYSDHQSLDQAKRQAAWLSQWLSSAIGEEVSARAIVALPGWFVKRTSADGIPVVNPNQIETLLKHIKPRPLSESMIERIVQQIERHCSRTDHQGAEGSPFPGQ